MTPVLSSFQRSLVSNALAEWERWGRGTVKETNPEMLPTLKQYWTTVGSGSLTPAQMVDYAWSGAFISTMVDRSGGGEGFKKSFSHSVYTRDAIKNRKENNSNPWKAYKPSEVKLQLGDIIVYPRQSGVTYDTTTQYLGHGDIVTDIVAGKAASIGGNVSNSVSMTKVPLVDGKIDLSATSKPYIAVVRREGPAPRGPKKKYLIGGLLLLAAAGLIYIANE